MDQISEEIENVSKRYIKNPLEDTPHT